MLTYCVLSVIIGVVLGSVNWFYSDNGDPILFDMFIFTVCWPLFLLVLSVCILNELVENCIHKIGNKF